MIDKRMASADEAVAGIQDGATVLLGGFGHVGTADHLLDALIRLGARELTVVSNNAGVADDGLARLLDNNQVRKIICSYPRSAGSVVFERLYDAGRIELEVVPQGTLSERMRAAGAGIGGFYTRTSVGTLLAEGKEVKRIGEHDYVLELPIHGDVALIRGDRGDRWGNLTYSKAARNFGPTMAMAAKLTIAEVREVVELGEIDPEHVVTPGIFVDRVVAVG
jgi:3-oxoadipate CoA-transferase alpha subunit